MKKMHATIKKGHADFSSYPFQFLCYTHILCVYFITFEGWERKINFGKAESILERFTKKEWSGEEDKFKRVRVLFTHYTEYRGEIESFFLCVGYSTEN